MDRAPIEQIQLGNIYAIFPEFRAFKHRVPFLTPKQQHMLILRMALNSIRVGECICWCAHCNNDGYPKTNFNVFGSPRSLYVHQLALSMKTGRDPRHWEEAGHGCDMPGCINPKHLAFERIVSNRRRSADNTNRKKARGLRRRRREHEERASA
jgi:hypothetical protein